ncbi:MAG: S8 family peptidase [Thermoanaerobaculia bacterium]
MIRTLAGALALALLLLDGCASAPAGTAAATPPEPPPADRQVMVTYPAASPALWARTTLELEQNYGLRTIYAWTMASLGEQCVVFEVPRGRTPQELARRLSADPRISGAQPVETFHTEATDPYAHLQRSSQTLRLDQAHRWSTGKGVRVAVVDTGVDFDHPDLRGRVVKARNFVDRGEGSFTTDIHGTAVAGLIAASADNDIGIVGVAPGAEIYALKACWQQPPAARQAVCDSYTLAKAVDFAITQGAQVLNFSLGGPPDPLLGKLIGNALSRGIVVVAADGGATARGFPASLEGVIGIVGSDDAKRPGLAAPSVDILTTTPHGAYDFFSGSSLAAAQVSGIAALLLEKNPRLRPAELAAVIRKTAHPLSPAGVGEVDACAAVASVSGTGCK